MLVAVSQRVDEWPERAESRDALDQRVATFVAAAGGVCVPVPNLGRGDAISDWLAAVRPAAIVLSGGNDIGSRPERDGTEAALLDHARVARLPVLGICRGMQMMGVWAGASLRQVVGHVRTRHRLSGVPAVEVNSFHNHSLAGCPAGFEVVARSEDGEIEAMRHLELPFEGWMWHPEREASFDPRDIAGLRRLLRA